MSPLRVRELLLLVLAGLIGAVGAVTVASARLGRTSLAPLIGVGVLFAIFLAMHVLVRWRIKHADPLLLPLVGVLTAIGLVSLYRLSPAVAEVQARWVAIGAAVFAAVVFFLPDHRILERYRYIIGLVGLLLLVATMIFGQNLSQSGAGARLWIPIGGGQTVQLGEVSKILVVIFLAGYLRDHREVLAIPTQRHLGVQLPAGRHLAPMLAFCLIALALAGVLNDFGTALLFFGIFLAMLYLASGRIAYVAAGTGAFLVGCVGVWLTVPKIRVRVDTWLHPFNDPLGTGYQMVQSLYALGEGGLFGPGLGKGLLISESGATKIPAQKTDFIFSAPADELGFVGGVAIILIVLLLVGRGLAIASRANDGFSKLLAAGLTTAIGLQTLVILGGIVRLFPLTGVTFPFMSYGGSSVVTNFLLVALLLIISHRSAAPQRLRGSSDEGLVA